MIRRAIPFVARRSGLCRTSFILLLAGAFPAVGQTTVAPPPAPLPYDSLTVRTLLAEAFAAAQQIPANDRTSMLSAVGRTQVTVRDYTGAARTLALLDHDVSSARVSRVLAEPAIFALLDRAPLARRLSCALYEENRPDSALAIVRAMRTSTDRDWELAHIAVISARGGRSPWIPASSNIVDRAALWRSAFALAREITLPTARLDALIGITGSIPDSSTSRDPTVAKTNRDALESAYIEARRITLADTDRQRSRDVMLAAMALRLGRTDDVRLLFARLSNAADLHDVVWAAAARPHDAPLAREFAPRAVQAGRAIRDSAAREEFLTALWATLSKAGGRSFADSLLHEATASADHPHDLRAILDSAAAADARPEARARRALDKRDFAEVRRQAERTPIADRRARRAALWTTLAWEVYMSNHDTALAYLRDARAALIATRRDSATINERVHKILELQFMLGDTEEGLRTLRLLRGEDAATYAINSMGNPKLPARMLRSYADSMPNSAVHDALLAHVVRNYLVGPKVTDADAAWGRALADSIATPVPRLSALSAIANEALRRGDSTEARRRFLALLNDRTLPHEGETFAARGLTGDLVRAGGWREAIEGARGRAEPIARARQLISVASVLQALLNTRNSVGGRGYSNGPDWCLDEF